MSSPTQSTGNANMRPLSRIEQDYLMPHPYIGQMLWWWPGATSQQIPIAGVCCKVSDHSIDINLQVSDSATAQVHSGVRWKKDPRPIPSREVAEEGVWDFIDKGVPDSSDIDAGMLRAKIARESQDAALLAAHPKIPVEETKLSDYVAPPSGEKQPKK